MRETCEARTIDITSYGLLVNKGRMLLLFAATTRWYSQLQRISRPLHCYMHTATQLLWKSCGTFQSYLAEHKGIWHKVTERKYPTAHESTLVRSPHKAKAWKRHWCLLKISLATTSSERHARRIAFHTSTCFSFDHDRSQCSVYTRRQPTGDQKNILVKNNIILAKPIEQHKVAA